MHIQIAKDLGGCTRNAVIGVVHRRGWSRPEPKVSRIRDRLPRVGGAAALARAKAAVPWRTSPPRRPDARPGHRRLPPRASAAGAAAPAVADAQPGQAVDRARVRRVRLPDRRRGRRHGVVLPAGAARRHPRGGRQAGRRALLPISRAARLHARQPLARPDPFGAEVRVMCQRCAELEEEVAYLRSELASWSSEQHVETLARALHIRPAAARVLALRRQGAHGRHLGADGSDRGHCHRRRPR